MNRCGGDLHQIRDKPRPTSDNTYMPIQNFLRRVAPLAPSQATDGVPPRGGAESASDVPGSNASVFDAQAGRSSFPQGGGTALGGSSPLGVRLSPDALLPERYRLPERVPLGAATIHRYDDPRVSPPTIAVTVWAPLPPANGQASVQNLNEARPSDPLPDRFIVTDAGLTRAFIGIDKRPGTLLDQKLTALIAKMPKNAQGGVEPEAAIEWVRKHVNDLIRWTPGSSANDGRAEFDWDKAIQVPSQVWDTFSAVAYESVGHLPASAGVDYPVVPFERYLEAGQGYCIQKALLAALLLDKLGVPSKIVNGAVAQGPGRSVGHTWVELEGGRVLDAAWGQIQQKAPATDGFADRFRFGSSNRFANQTFPYLVFHD